MPKLLPLFMLIELECVYTFTITVDGSFMFERAQQIG